LKERISGEEDGLTVEEISAKAEQMKQRRATQQKVTALKAKLDGRESAKGNKHKAKVIATRKHACDTCNVVCYSVIDLNNHNTSKRHLDKVAGITRVVKDPADKAYIAKIRAMKRYSCNICGINSDCQSRLNQHLASKKHLRNVAAAGKSSATIS
jgi:hypothetical protein